MKWKSKFRIIYVILNIGLLFGNFISDYAPLMCNEYSPWDVSTIDSNFQRSLIFDWLYARQNDIEGCSKLDGYREGGHGIGASILGSLKMFLFALERGNVYKPSVSWLWAGSATTSNCTLGKPTYDCYSLPLSLCFEPKDTQRKYERLHFNFTEAYSHFGNAASVCLIANAAKKPTLWVLGVVLDYHSFRLRHDIHEAVQARVYRALVSPLLEHSSFHSAKNISDKSNRNSSVNLLANDSESGMTGKGLTMAVHLRTINPYNDPLEKRHSTNLSRVMSVVDTLAEKVYSDGNHIRCG
jgi:hypothetical protein